MSRLTISLATMLVLAMVGVEPLAAQDGALGPAIPMSDVLATGVRASDLHRVAVGTAPSLESRSAPLEVDAIIHRRERFFAAGAATGMALATVWAFRRVNVKDGGLGIVALPFLLPIVWIPGGAFGGAVGYGVSFLFYPTERVNRPML